MTKTNGKPKRTNGKPRNKEELLGKAETSGYRPTDTRWFRRPRDLPPMTWIIIEQMLMEPTIRLGLAMRAAPLMNCEFAYKKPGDKEWTEGIRASSPIVAEFVHRQLKRIWRDLDALLCAQIWGWAAAEVMYHLTNHGTVEVSRLLPRHSRDVRALVRDGDICGVRFNRLQAETKTGEDSKGHADLFFPKCIFHRHNPQASGYYGITALEGCYSPWYDKWGNGGALDVLRLTMQQNSINGRRGYYPDGVTELPIGPGGALLEVPNRDVFRMILEEMMAGGVAAMPGKRDGSGNREWEMIDATAMQGLQHVLQYPKDKDQEILRGLEIPDDVLSADNSGAWEGKKVPMMAFCGGLDKWLGGMTRDVSQQILEPVVAMNFGEGQWFEVETKPLAQQAMEQAKANEPQQPKQFGGFMPQRDEEGEPKPTRMSLDPVEAVGQGVLDAAELVKAARKCLPPSQPEMSPAEIVRLALESVPRQPGITLGMSDATASLVGESMSKATASLVGEIGDKLSAELREGFAAQQRPIVNVPPAVNNMPAPIVLMPEYDIKAVFDEKTKRTTGYERVPKGSLRKGDA